MPTESLVPGSTSRGLESVLVTVLLEDTLVRQGSQHDGHFLAESGAVVGEVLDEQIDEVVDRGPDADVTGSRRRQQADEVDQPEDAAAQRLLLPLLVDESLGLLQQQAGAVEVLVLGRVQVVGTDDGSDRLVGNQPVGVVHDAKLRAQLPCPAGVGLSQDALPEPAAAGQQRVVLDQVGVVLRGVLNLAADELPRDLARDTRERALKSRALRGLLVEKDPSDDCIDVLVLQDDLDGESVLDLLEGGVGGELLLAGGDEEHPPIELARHGLDEVLDLHRAPTVAADVLLNLIEHDQRRRDRSTADVLENLAK